MVCDSTRVLQERRSDYKMYLKKKQTKTEKRARDTFRCTLIYIYLADMLFISFHIFFNLDIGARKEK